MDYQNYFIKAREAYLSFTKHDKVDKLLKYLAGHIDKNVEQLLAANQIDLDRMPQTDPRHDRLRLTPDRIAGISDEIRNIVSLPSPLGKILEEHVRPNRLKISKVSVPFGVVGIVYESRPNVTFDVFS